MFNKVWFRKNRYTISIIVISLLVISSLSIIITNQKGRIENLPALMDAKGKIELKVGDFKLEKQPFLGDPHAPVKVIEFIDFKCPSCATWEVNNFELFKKEFIDTGKVQFYVINFPFLGPDSIEAALVAESIYKQNPVKYWEFKQTLYRNQGKEERIWATEKYLLDLIGKNIKGINMDQLKKDLNKHTYLLDVKEDFKISAANGIYGTPTFLVNGARSGGDYNELKKMINQQLQ